MATDYYLVLGIPRDANLPQIRRAFRALARARGDVLAEEQLTPTRRLFLLRWAES